VTYVFNTPDTLIDDVHGRVDFVEEGAGKLGILRAQEIPDDFIASVQDRKKGRFDPSAQYRFVGEIPTIFVAKWLTEGFDVYREPFKAIIAKCHKEGLEGFIAQGV
jgi:hypothetical protein